MTENEKLGLTIEQALAYVAEQESQWEGIGRRVITARLLADGDVTFAKIRTVYAGDNCNWVVWLTPNGKIHGTWFA